MIRRASAQRAKHGITAFVIAMALSGCARRPGLNFDCQWVPETPFQIDLSNSAHVQHLLSDLRTAEELEIRYGDRLTGRSLVVVWGIVTRHGGGTRFDVGREARRQCLPALFKTVATSHGLTISQVEAMRSALADKGLDLPVNAPLAALYLWLLVRFARWIRNRFETTEISAWVITTLMASVFLTFSVLAVGTLWNAAVEIIRVGNEHMSYRAARASIRSNWAVMGAIGVAGVWLASGVAKFRRASNPDESRLTAVH